MHAVGLAHRFLEGRSQTPLAQLEHRMQEAAARLDFEYAGLLRDRLDRLRLFQEELAAFRGQVQDLSFIYRVPGFAGDDRIYLIRRGRIRKELPHPKSTRARARTARAVEAVYGEAEAGLPGLAPQDAAEILLVARWFRQNPAERRRTMTPERWLQEKRPA